MNMKAKVWSIDYCWGVKDIEGECVEVIEQRQEWQKRE